MRHLIRQPLLQFAHGELPHCIVQTRVQQDQGCARQGLGLVLARRRLAAVKAGLARAEATDRPRPLQETL